MDKEKIDYIAGKYLDSVYHIAATIVRMRKMPRMTSGVPMEQVTEEMKKYTEE